MDRSREDIPAIHVRAEPEVAGGWPQAQRRMQLFAGRPVAIQGAKTAMSTIASSKTDPIATVGIAPDEVAQSFEP